MKLKLNKIYKAIFVFLTVFTCRAYAMEVIPSGECVGVKLYTDGLIVIDSSAITGNDGVTYDTARDHDIRKGDIITKINGKSAVSNEMLISEINAADGDITLTIKHGGKERDVTITPADTDSGRLLGLWLRDSTAGLGTITCYYNNSFAALGHGIFDTDTGNIMPVGKGIIQDCSVTAVIKGSSGAPGAITGDINGEFLGSVTNNTEMGLFGNAAAIPDIEPVEVASPKEVCCGDAAILADVDGNGVKEYNIKIKRITPFGASHDMIIQVTDPALIEKTGGIIQGMSGAPIMQNGKLAGAVTHVFVNDAASGYAILASHMLSGME